jgi:hypothetical protein
MQFRSRPRSVFWLQARCRSAIVKALLRQKMDTAHARSWPKPARLATSVRLRLAILLIVDHYTVVLPGSRHPGATSKGGPATANRKALIGARARVQCTKHRTPFSALNACLA